MGKKARGQGNYKTKMLQIMLQWMPKKKTKKTEIKDKGQGTCALTNEQKEESKNLALLFFLFSFSFYYILFWWTSNRNQYYGNLMCLLDVYGFNRCSISTFDWSTILLWFWIFLVEEEPIKNVVKSDGSVFMKNQPLSLQNSLVVHEEPISSIIHSFYFDWSIIPSCCVWRTTNQHEVGWWGGKGENV